MLKKIWIQTPLALLLLTGVSATTVAAGFYTIIGPDGRPMVVPERTPKKNAEHPQPTAVNVIPEKAPNAEIQPKKIEHSVSVPPQVLKKEIPTIIQANQANQVIAIKETAIPTTEKVKVIEQVDQNIQKSQPTISDKKDIQGTIGQGSKIVATVSTQPLKQSLAQQAETSSSETQQALKLDKKIQSQVEQHSNNFIEIDGVQYVNNEYLEASEFNLEGKKRFYIMPEAGSTGAGHHVETVERKKGLGHSLIEKIQQQKPEVATTIALSPTYYRLPKTEVVESLQKACFTDKKVQKAKILDLKNKDVGFWPVAPIKEDFAYEVVKLDEQVSNILLTSYASSQKSPSYYWPLVVFLDQQGCVVEGVSGFKNQNLDENNMKHAAMEGILQKPVAASYMFMTPLSAAVDAENIQLTNHGQIKLSVIR